MKTIRIHLVLLAALLAAIALTIPAAVGTAPAVASAECSDDNYIAFLRSYLPKVDAAARAGAASLQSVRDGLTKPPCATTEKGYLALFQQWTQRWEQSMTDGALSVAEADMLDTVAAARPQQAGARAYAAWHNVYQGFLQTATQPTANRQGPFPVVDEPRLVINRDESRALRTIETVRPHATDEKAWMVWFETYNGYVKRVTDSSDYRQRNAINQTERALFDRLLTVRPNSNGEGAYLSWLKIYVPLLQRAAAQGLAKHQGQLQIVLEAKPCGPGPKASEVYGRVSRLRSKFAGSPQFVDQAGPDCRS